ncbi:MAG: hypothetical protein A3F13_06715 [Gammaproteobacteria bacterium RIFCSPHIGHO2_12_FULL_40_19]|nr:MAG: hypothetical protein A3F13_06715 [Gammaproteobacteria bacterium RIFCSPHIGHO2_12_FULL_40_19]
MTHCPFCHARVTIESITDATICVRCKGDYGFLLLIQKQSHDWLLLACYHFIRHELDSARDCAKQAKLLHHTHFSQCVERTVCLHKN